MNAELRERVVDELYRRELVRREYPRADARWLAEHHAVGAKIAWRLVLGDLRRAVVGLFRRPGGPPCST